MENHKQFDRNELIRGYEDIQFRILVHDYSMYEAEIIQEENSNVYVLPTADASKRFSRVMDKAFQRERRQVMIRSLPKTLNRVAVILFVCLFMFSVSIVSVQALRVDFLNLLISFQKEYTSIHLDSINMVVGDSLIVPWSASYAPIYVPVGYKIIRINYSEHMKAIYFEKDSNKSISYYEYADANAANLDTENADLIEEVHVNGFKGLFIEKDGYTTVAWAMQNRMFIIVAQIDRDEIVRIAENVKYIE